MSQLQLPIRWSPRELRASGSSVAPQSGDTCHRAVPMLAQVGMLDYAGGLLVGAGGRVCCVWDIVTGEVRHRWVLPDAVAAVSLRRDSTGLAIAFDNTVRVYSLHTGDVWLEYSHGSPVHSVHIGKSGTYLASAGTSGDIQLHNLGANLRADIAYGRKCVVHVDPCDRSLAVETPDEIVFFDLRDGRKTRVFSQHDVPRLPLECDPRSQVLVAPSGHWIRLFELERDQGPCFRALQFRGTVQGVDIGAGNRFLVATTDLRIGVFDLHTGKGQSVQQTATGPLLAARFGPGSDLLAAAGEPLVLRLSGGAQTQSYGDLVSPIVSGALHPDRQSLLMSDRDGGIACFDLRSGDRNDAFAGHRGSVSTVRCDERYVVSGAYDGACRVRLWDGTHIATFELGEGPIQALALESGGERLWVGAFSGAIACYDLRSARRLWHLPGRGASVRSLAYCAETRLLLSCSFDGFVRVRMADAPSKVVSEFLASDPAYRGAFDTNGSVLVASGRGLCRYDAATGRFQARYGEAAIRGFCVLDDGSLCTLGLWGELEVFDADTGARRRHRKLDGAYMHRFVLALGPDRIVIGSADGEARVFDYSLAPIATLMHLRQGVLWMTGASAGHPGWVYTDRPDLLEVGAMRDGLFVATTDALRRQQHLALYNSASHSMERVRGQETTRSGDALGELRARLAARPKLLRHER